MHLHTHANLSTTMQNGDFEALHDALSAINLSSIVGHNNIDDDWRCWKDLFLAAVKDFMPSKRLKGHNPVPWIDSNNLNLIKKKNSVCQKLKSHPNAGLTDKFKSLRAQVRKLLRESCDHFYDFIDTGFRFNPKCSWSILKLNSKSYPIPGHVSMQLSQTLCWPVTKSFKSKCWYTCGNSWPV